MLFPMTPWVLRLIVANVAVFFVSASVPMVANLGALVPAAILVRPWTPITYMFLHGGLGHLFFNMLALFFFGPRLEERLGARSFLALYFLSGLGGALGSFLFSFGSAVIGASGAVFGVLLGFAWFWPREQILIWGVLPVESRWLVAFMAVISLWSGITGTQAGTAHFAHLGGFAAGGAYLWWKRRYKSKAKREWEKKAKVGGGPSRSPLKDRTSLQRWKSTIPLDRLHELNREEVRELLRKAEEQGVGSLKPEERTFLDRMAQM